MCIINRLLQYHMVQSITCFSITISHVLDDEIVSYKLSVLSLKFDCAFDHGKVHFSSTTKYFFLDQDPTQRELCVFVRLYLWLLLNSCLSLFILSLKIYIRQFGI